MQKKSTWLANFSLTGLELDCRNARCAVSCTHEHRQVKGGVSTDQGYVNLASYSGKYTPEQATVYAREVKSFIHKNFHRRRGTRKTEMTHLERLARASEARWKGAKPLALQAMVCQETFPIQQWEEQYQATFGYDDPVCPQQDTDKEAAWLVGDEELLPSVELGCIGPQETTATTYPELEYLAGGGVLDYHSGFKLDEAFTLRDRDQYCGRTEIPQNVKAPKPVDQYNRVLQKAGDDEVLDITTSHEVELKKREETARHDEAYAKAKQYWKSVADKREWDTLAADLEVYKYCGTRVEKDPRRNDEYRKQVIDGLGFGDDWETRAPHLTKDCLLYTSPSPRDRTRSRMPSSA